MGLRVILVLLLGLINNIAAAETYEDRAFRVVAEEEGVEEYLLRAICWHESGHKPRALREGDGGHKNSAFGICQILYSTATHLGIKDERCLDFTEQTPHSERIYKNCKLFGPKTNIRLAAKYFKQKIKENKGNVFKAIASYNTGTYKKCRDGWLYYKGKRWKKCIKGGPVNLYYIIEIRKAINENR